MAGIPGFSLPPDSTDYAREDDVVADPFTVEDGRRSVPEGPGLGVEVDPDAVDRYRV